MILKFKIYSFLNTVIRQILEGDIVRLVLGWVWYGMVRYGKVRLG